MTRVTTCLVAVLSVGTWAMGAPAEDDLGWIGKIPGLSLRSEKTVAEGRRTVYGLAAESGDVLGQVRDGLTDRGWAVERDSGSGIAGVSARTLVATKGDARVKVVLGDALGFANLSVTVGGAAVAPTTRARAGDRVIRVPGLGSIPGLPGTTGARVQRATPAPPRDPAPATAAAAEGPLQFGENGVSGSHACGGRDVVVNGNYCRLTLEGKCGTVTLNGNTNTVRITGTVGTISTMGNGNTVAWVAAANAKPPHVSDLGSGNQVKREED